MAATTVRTPVEGFTGTVVGVAFDNGVGETDSEAALAYFRRHNYTLDQPKRAPAKKPAKPSE